MAVFNAMQDALVSCCNQAGLEKRVNDALAENTPAMKRKDMMPEVIGERSLQKTGEDTIAG